MLAISPQLYCNLCWPSEQVVSHERSSYDPIYDRFMQTTTTTSPTYTTSTHTLGLSGSPLQQELEEINGDANLFFQSPTPADPSSNMKRKLTHNAVERNRRKKLNSLYSSLRSLLPGPADQKKKLSIPSTVGRVLQYIPELQRQVERLKRRKEEMLDRMPEKGDMNPNISSTCGKRSCSIIYPVVSTTPVGDGEIMVQVCCSSNNGRCSPPPISEILRNLETVGFVLMNASSFTINGEDSGVMYNLHLQAKGSLMH